jgi:NAD-dependent DNA ligase
MEPFDRNRYTPTYISRLESDVFQEGNKLTIARLEQLLHDASYAYYNTERALLSDAAFDTLIDLLKQKKPDSKVLTTIGAELPIDAPNKVELPYHLGSMDKVKPGSRDLELWLTRFNKGPYIISEKLDGLSGLLILKPDPTGTKIEKHLYRRGDSDIAQEVSHLLNYVSYLSLDGAKTETALLKYIKSLPTQTLAVRGEIIIRKSVFNAKYQTRYPKTRSLINGVALSKLETFSRPELQSTARDVEYVVYSILDPPGLTHEKQFALADKLGFHTAHHIKIQQAPLTLEHLQETLLDFKANSHYDIDGIIISDDSKVYEAPTSGNPKYSVAFKMMLDEQTQLTTVKRVEWNVTKNKLLKPRVEFEAVKIGGDTIMFATGFNAKFIKDNGIGPGARIRIVRSGDVIPYIESVITPAPGGWAQPQEISWSWTDTRIDIQPTNLSETPDFINKNLLQFFNTLGVEGLQAGTLDKLIGAGFDTLELILGIRVENLLDVSGFQIKSAQKLVENINKFVLSKEHPLQVLMVASNLFPGFGIKKLDVLVAGFPDTRAILSNRVSLEQLVAIPGFSDISASKFLEYLPAFIQWLKAHPMLRVSTERPSAPTVIITPPPPGSKLVGKIIVFTGFRDKALEEKIAKLGGKVVDNITSTTDIIIAKDPDSGSSKLQKARERGITIMSGQDFIKSML